MFPWLFVWNKFAHFNGLGAFYFYFVYHFSGNKVPKLKTHRLDQIRRKRTSLTFFLFFSFAFFNPGALVGTYNFIAWCILATLALVASQRHNVKSLKNISLY